MSIINFTIPTNLATRINKVIQKKGFTSKAEFFRFVALQYIDDIEEDDYELERFAQLSASIEQSVLKKYSGKVLPPLSKQLKNIG